MAVSIDSAGTYKVVRVDNADTATGWSVVKLEGSGGAPSLLASVGTIDLVAEGTNARAARTNKQRVQIKFTYAAGYDFTAGSTGTGTTKVPSGIASVWALFLAAGSMLTEANGGMQISLGDGTNNSYWNVAGSGADYSGGFEKWARYTGIASDEQSTPVGGASTTDAVLGDITEIGFVTDVGGATTRFDNMVVDAIDVGNGLTLQGTTTTDKLFAEALVQDQATAIGALSEKNDKIFSQGSLELSGTNLASSSESLTFTDTVGGVYTYDLDITGTVSFNNTSIDASGAVDYNFDASAATSFTMSGGGLSNFLSFITLAGQSIEGAVFQSGGTSTIANTLSDSAFNQCGAITVTGLLDAVTVNKSTATEASVVDNLNKIAGSIFIKDTGTSNATRLTSIGGGSMTWSCTTTNYDAGATGSPVTPTSTGNEDIFVDVASGTLTINVADGATTPSIRSSGATVNVVAGLIAITVTVVDDITGLPLENARVWLGEEAGHATIINAETNASGVVTTNIPFTSDTNIIGWARQMDLLGTDYVQKDFSGQYTSSGFSTTIRLSPI